MKSFFALTLAATVGVTLASAASAAPLRIRGAVVSITPTALIVHTAQGNVAASLTPGTAFVSVVPSNLDHVGPGSYLGVASKDGGDKRIALSVIVFPPSMKGAAEGNAVYDPIPDTTLAGSARTASNMTNANVRTISASQGVPHVNSTMTNANVAAATARGGVRFLTLTYKGGEQHILVPPTAPVVAFVPGAASLARPGAPVFVLSDASNGKISAGLVAVGADGLTPPF